MTEWFPVDLVALGAAVILMVLGLVTPEEGISGFSNTATITVMSMFIVSAGIARTGILQSVRILLLNWGGKSLGRQTFVLGTMVGILSAFINNTSVVAIFLPIVEDFCKKQGISVSRLLIPISYTAILGGMLTLVGTSTNILASSISKQLGYDEFSLFEFTTIGLPVFFIGLTYLVIFTPILLPARKQPSGTFNQDYALDDYVSEIVVNTNSSLVGQTLRSSQLQRKFDIDVLEIIRDNVRFPQPLADKVLRVGDILIVRGNKGDLLLIREERGLGIAPDVKFNQANIVSELSSEEEEVAEVLILSNSRLNGETLKDIRFRQRYNATVLAIRRGEELLQERLGQIPLKFGDLLLVQGPKQSFLGLQTTRELLVLEQRDVEMFRPKKVWIALSIIAGFIVISGLQWLPLVVTALLCVVIMVLTRCLKPGEIYGTIRWDVIFLLAGLFPLGIAMDKSGANEWIVEQLLRIGNHLPSYGILVLFYLVTVVLTEVLSNNASAVLMVPIAAKAAESIGLPPMAAILTVTFAASNSYMTPIGYQTNTMVYSPGGYRFLDFTRIGAPLSLLLALITPFLIVQKYAL